MLRIVKRKVGENVIDWR